MVKLVLRSHPSWGLFKKAVKVWSLAVSVTWWRQKRNLQLRGESSALLMKRTAVRQSPSSLCLWCLSMFNTHSMIQNILKYRTVIIDLQNIHPRVRGICILLFFSWQGVLTALEAKLFKGILSLSSHSDTEGLLSIPPLFYTKQRWQGSKNNHTDSTLLSRTENYNSLFTHVNTNTRSHQSDIQIY